MANSLTCIVVNLNEQKATLAFSGKEIEIEKDKLPESLKVGDELKLFFLKKHETSTSEKALAKGILEEILNGE